MSKVLTVWVHRASACDLLVLFSSAEEAYGFSEEMINEYGGEWGQKFTWDYKTFSDGGCFHAGVSEDLQISIHPGRFHHSGWLGRIGWNTRGTALIDKEEALDLGNYLEPSGFTPDESEESIWIRDKRSTVDLDTELSDYFRLGEIEEEQRFGM